MAGGRQVSLAPVPDAVPDVIQRSQFVSHTDPNQTLHVSLNLQVPNMAALQSYADSVSDPHSPNYRNFITPAQIGEKFGQSPATIANIVNYLKSAGMTITLVAQDNLHVLADGTVSQVESAFHTSINNFHALNSQELGRTDYFSFSKVPQLPSQMASLVQHIGGLQNQSMPHHMTTITPNQARVFYNSAPEFNAGMYGQGRTIAYSNWDGYRTSNLTKWYSTYSLPAPSGGVGSNVTIIKIDGGSGTGYPGAEGDLDMQMILGEAPQCTELIYDGNANGSGEPTDVLTKELNDNLADVISESYGWNLGSSTNSACHTVHVEMTTAGITYLAAAGDSGTSISSYPYPDIEPEVLIVGGAAAQTDSSGNFVSETGWNGGGGGWVVTSDSFNKLPSWQVANGVPTNINYRLTPDISAQAAGDQYDDTNAVYFIYDGSLATVSGTSCASPLMAGALGIAEQKLIALGGLPANSAGKQRFGRINDLFYSQNLRSDVWYDITVGSNGKLPNGTTSNAGTGWDFVTGLGSINIDAFVNSVAPASFAITSLNPASGYTNTSFTLTVNGAGFVSGSVVDWNGAALATTYVSPNQLTAQVTTTQTATAGTYPVTVVNPGPTTSNAVNFTVNQAVAPSLTTLSPTSGTVGSSLTLTVNGSGFVNGATVLWNGTALTTTYVSSSQVTAAVTSAQTASTGTYSITATNPGSGASNSLTFTVSNVSTPTLTKISPTTTTTSSAFTLTATGTGFVSGATVLWNGTALTTTFVSSTSVTAKVTATQTATNGTYPISVKNPDGGTTGTINISVQNVSPTLSSVSPTTIAVGSAATKITCSGFGFISSSSVLINGTAITTTYVNSKTVTAVVPASYLATAGTLTVQVKNPAPGGGTSGKVSITVK
jgi:subtilase family serine protease